MHPDAKHFVESEKQFHLGKLVTEQFHPLTLDLSQTAQTDAAAGLRKLLAVDRDVLARLREWAHTGQAEAMAADVVQALEGGGRVFFAGCGATGRLSILLDQAWRRFWQDIKTRAPGLAARLPDWQDRSASVMSGGDYALIRSVEGYEDYAAFGRRQMQDRGVAPGDALFAITEGGETSFVIGAAWQGVDTGARVSFVYNNPGHCLADIRRSAEIIADRRVRDVCIHTGPMAISGSTRMQATTTEMAVAGCALEIALDQLVRGRAGAEGLAQAGRPLASAAESAESFGRLLAALNTEENVAALTDLTLFERDIYAAKGMTTYIADSFALDLLTDTTERSPTFLAPPFRKRGDEGAAPSWFFLVLPQPDAESAWRRMLRRDLNPIDWTRDDIAVMLGGEAARMKSMPRLDRNEILRFDISEAGAAHRLRSAGDGLAVFVDGRDPGEAQRLKAAFSRLVQDRAVQARVVFVGTEAEYAGLRGVVESFPGRPRVLKLLLPDEPGLLGFARRLGLKMAMNAVSTLTMTLLGRVLGNCMIWVSPSNKKLYDRATRYVAQLAGSSYHDACSAVYHVMDRLRPRQAAGQETPSPVLLAAVALLAKAEPAQAEALLAASLAKGESADALLGRLKKGAG